MKPQRRLVALVISTILAFGIIAFQPSTVQASTSSAQVANTIQLSSSAVVTAGGYWYRVPSGATLSSIAYSVYRSSSLWSLIYNANRTRISNPNYIYVGQSIYLPAYGSSTYSVASTASTRARTVINYALAQVGKQYCWGGDGPYCYDCSGLVMMSFRRIGIYLPHQSGSMLRYGVRISRASLRPGDIVWPQWGHVAIYLGNNRIVHAANPRNDIYVGSLYGFYTARRVIR